MLKAQSGCTKRATGDVRPYYGKIARNEFLGHGKTFPSTIRLRRTLSRRAGHLPNGQIPFYCAIN